MFSADFLQMLRCPESRTTLAEADASLVARLNDAVDAGTLRNRGGELVTRKLEAGLVRADGAIVYPVFDGIPVLLIDEGVPLTQAVVSAASDAATRNGLSP